MNQRGVTIAEMSITAAVLGLMTLLIASTSQMMARSQLRQQAEAELTTNAAILHKHLRLYLERAGDGVPNYRADGRHIVADQDATNDDAILFLWRDAAPVPGGPATTPGDVDTADTWVRFRVDNGRLVEEQFTGALSWRDILANPGAFLRTVRPVPLASPGVEVQSLVFSYYDPSNTKIDDGYAVSRVRVSLELAMKGSSGSPHRFVRKKDAWVLLKNVVNARTL